MAILTHILQAPVETHMLARVVTHVLARVITHVLVCYPMVQAHVLLHVLARVVTHVLAHVVTHVLARVIMHVHDYYLKTCLRAPTSSWWPFGSPRLRPLRPSGAQAG